ncbi:FGGY-family carbohydrate kinase [Phytohabitans flavus]|uniref:xylulokinase n=1 Tax=Phytohabitans flavus TaxID=1076124 RepID=UPI00363E89AD
MRAGPVLGVDVGTSSTKAVLFDPEAGVLGTGAGAHPVDTPHPGHAEQDPEDWYGSVRLAVRTALAVAGVPGDAVTALAVSGQGAALVALDEAGKPLRPAIIHLDQRAEAEAAALAQSPLGADIRRAHGAAVGAWNAGAKISWLRRHEPESATAATYTSASGFVLRRLTGQSWQSHSDAGISDLYDLAGRRWSPAALEALDLAPDRLPALAAGTSALGPLTPAAAADLGLRSRCAVVAGGEDTSSAALAAGVTGSARGFLSMGTAAVLGVALRRDLGGSTALLRFPHVLDGLDLLSGSTATVGAALAWLGDLLDRTPQELLDLAAAAPPGADGVDFLPHLAGSLHPVDDPAARGAFTGLSLASSPGALARAVAEGTAAAISDNLAAARDAGAEPDELAAVGGPTRSPLWCQAVADATGLPVALCGPDGAPLGDAFLAAAESDAEAAALAAAHVQIRRRYEPSPDGAEAATARRARLDRVYQATVER